MIIEQNPIIMIDITALQTEVPKHQLSLAEPLTDEGGAPRLGKDYEIEKQYELCPRVLFCGEATHPDSYGTVHGARQTGLREAAR